jgi:hypothetical protein
MGGWITLSSPSYIIGQIEFSVHLDEGYIVDGIINGTATLNNAGRKQVVPRENEWR